MPQNRFLFGLLGGVLALVIVLRMCTFTVRETENAIVIVLGNPRGVVTEAGLNFKLPWADIVKVDKRNLEFDLDRAMEVSDVKQERLTVDAFARRYRLLEPSFLADLAAALEPAGVVHFATDSRDYAEEVVTALAEVSGLVNTLPAPGWVTTPPAERTTVFEERWRAEGRTIHAMRFNRAPGPAAPPGD